jgi:hypothetical protein
MSLKEALRLADRLGCLVTKPRRTGEVLIRHEAVDRKIRVNCRRKDSTVKLNSFLIKVEREKEDDGRTD